jgi:hypothetical protein
MFGFALGAVSFIGAIKADFAEAGFGLYEAGLVLSLFSFVFVGRLLKGLNGSWRSMSLSLLALGCITWGASLFIPDMAAKTLTSFLILGGILHWNMRPTAMDNKVIVERKSESFNCGTE